VGNCPSFFREFVGKFEISIGLDLIFSRILSAAKPIAREIMPNSGLEAGSMEMNSRKIVVRIAKVDRCRIQANTTGSSVGKPAKSLGWMPAFHNRMAHRADRSGNLRPHEGLQ
jgi:hypothetical protein